MQRSVFLAKLIGPPFLAIALGLFLKSEYLLGDDRRDDPAPEPDRQYADLPLWSVVTARWSRHRERPSFVDPRLARDITIIGWLMVIGGIVRIVLPDIVLRVG